jgi:hypothetical protein
MFEIEYEFREQDLVHFNVFRYKKSEQYHNDMRKNRLIVPGIMWLISAFYYFYYTDLNTSVYIVIIGILWAVFVPRTLVTRWQRKLIESYTEKEKTSMYGKYTLLIDPEDPGYLQEKSPGGRHKMAWKDLVRVEYAPRYVHIYIDLSTALVIPVETVTKGNLEQFAEQCEKMIDRFS